LEEKPSQNIPVQWTPLDLTCSGLVTLSESYSRKVSQEAGMIIPKTRPVNVSLVIDYKVK
jgi:hypothetical protein